MTDSETSSTYNVMTNSRHRPTTRRQQSNNSLQVKVTQSGQGALPPRAQQPTNNLPPQATKPPTSPQNRQPTNSTGDPMQVDERSPVQLPPPTHYAKRQRCYMLNLDSEIAGLGSDVRVESSLLGPFAHDLPPLTYSGSEDSASQDPTEIAVRTAQIFRGLTVDRNGTILSQNARATRSSRNSNKQRRSEKSRQASKIDKAKDLVEETIITGKAPGSDEPAKLTSLYIMGEYDEMKHLVRDGSKKLREGTNYPDDSLLNLNRVRGSFRNPILSPSRKRVSPTPSSRPHPSSAPPKLKGHPRDRPSTRRLASATTPTQHQDHARQAAARQQFQPIHQDPTGCYSPHMVDGDWMGASGLSRGFHSIWNCGGASPNGGSASPTQYTNTHSKDKPLQPQQPNPAWNRNNVVQGRNDHHYSNHNNNHGWESTAAAGGVRT